MSHRDCALLVELMLLMVVCVRDWRTADKENTEELYCFSPLGWDQNGCDQEHSMQHWRILSSVYITFFNCLVISYLGIGWVAHVMKSSVNFGYSICAVT